MTQPQKVTPMPSSNNNTYWAEPVPEHLGTTLGCVIMSFRADFDFDRLRIPPIWVGLSFILLLRNVLILFGCFGRLTKFHILNFAFLPSVPRVNDVIDDSLDTSVCGTSVTAALTISQTTQQAKQTRIQEPEDWGCLKPKTIGSTR